MLFRPSCEQPREPWALFHELMLLELPTGPLTSEWPSIAERPRIKAYLASEQRIAFNESGIFRRYKELDR